MTRDEARARLALEVQSCAEPGLSDAELDQLLAQHACVDANGLSPGDTNWSPTYDFTAAAVAGWMLKAAKASQLHDVSLTGGRHFSARQLFLNCQAMAERYRKRIAATI